MAEKSFWQTFKDWATTGTSEAEAMEPQVVFKLLKTFAKTQGKHAPEQLAKIKEWEKLSKQLPSDFYAPVSKITPFCFKDPYVLAQEIGKTGEILLNLRKRHSLGKSVFHETAHAWQILPEKFTAKKLPKRVTVGLHEALKSNAFDFKRISEQLGLDSYRYNPRERHVKLLQQEAQKIFAGKESKLLPKKDFFPYFYSSYEQELRKFSELKTLWFEPKLSAKEIKKLDFDLEMIKRKTDPFLGKKVLSFEEWQKLFKELN